MAKQRKRQQRRNISSGIAAAPVVLVELARHHATPKSAAADFTRIGLIGSVFLERPCCGSSRFFAAFRVPSDLPDCTIRTFEGEVVAYTHGTDCNLSRWVARDMVRGEQSPWADCSRFAAGGVFRCAEIPDQIDEGIG